MGFTLGILAPTGKERTAEGQRGGVDVKETAGQVLGPAP